MQQRGPSPWIMAGACPAVEEKEASVMMSSGDWSLEVPRCFSRLSLGLVPGILLMQVNMVTNPMCGDGYRDS